MDLRKLLLARIKQHREHGDEERAARLEDALTHIENADVVEVLEVV